MYDSVRQCFLIVFCAGWEVYVSVGTEKRIHFRPPDQSKVLRSFRELEEYLKQHPQDLPHNSDVKIGVCIEAEMIDEDSGEKEWIRGKVEKRNKHSFQVRFTEDNGEELFQWVEEYSMNDKGTEWRWPILSKQDFADAVKDAKDACQKVYFKTNSKICCLILPVFI